MTAGPIATAASVVGATEPTARPREADVKDSSVRIAKNLANLSDRGAQSVQCGGPPVLRV